MEGEQPDGAGASDDGAQFTQEDLNRINAKHKRRVQELEEQLEHARVKLGEVDDLKTKLQQLSDEKELAGKSEIEKLQHQHAREQEKWVQKLKHVEDQLNAKEQAIQSAQQTLHGERMARAFSTALDSVDVYGPGKNDALEVLLSKVKDVQFTDDGEVRATYGELIDESPQSIAAKFLQERNWYQRAVIGGAGTERPNGAAPGLKGKLADYDAGTLFDNAGAAPPPVRTNAEE